MAWGMGVHVIYSRWLPKEVTCVAVFITSGLCVSRTVGSHDIGCWKGIICMFDMVLTL